MHFFASLVMDKTNETLGRTGGGGKSLKATPFSFFIFYQEDFVRAPVYFRTSSFIIETSFMCDWDIKRQARSGWQFYMNVLKCILQIVRARITEPEMVVKQHNNVLKHPWHAKLSN